MYIRIAFILAFASLFSACTGLPKIVRQSRPEAIAIRQEIRYHDDFARGADIVLPVGVYKYAWEDKGSWYYENSSVTLQVNITDRIPVSRPGGFSLAKEYDQFGVYLLCERRDLTERGVGDLVITMLPKRGGKIVSAEGIIPKAVESQFEIVGSVPVRPERPNQSPEPTS